MVIFFCLTTLIILAAISFMISASEAALISLNKIRLRHLVEKGVKNSKSLQRLIMKSDKLISLILIATNFVNVCISAIVTAIFVYFFEPKLAVILATISVTLFLLIFCEITPKMFAIQHPENISLFVAPLTDFLVSLLSPFVNIFTRIGNLLIRLFGGSPSRRSPLITEEEMRLMVEIGKEEGLLSEDERKMLHRIFEFGDIRVQDVMVPREKIVAIDRRAGQEELLRVLVEEGHSRVVVYEDSLDNISGIIYVHDLLYTLYNKSLFVLDDLIHPAYFVSLYTKVHELLLQFQAKKIQIAIVQDINKKTMGLVTLEDLVEEIVGDIEQGPLDILA